MDGFTKLIKQLVSFVSVPITIMGGAARNLSDIEELIKSCGLIPQEVYLFSKGSIGPY